MSDTRRPVPSPEEWAREQLENAPVRDEAWARRVARIYCLEVGEPVNDDEREAVRRAGVEAARASHVAASLPERIEDPAAVAQLAGLLRDTGTEGVVLSGRCGDCGYLLTSTGHEASCGR